MNEKNLTLHQYTSRFLKGVAASYLFFPVLYLVMTGIIFDIPASKFATILLSPLFYFVSGWSILAGFGLWKMVQWGWYVFLAANFLIIYQSAVIVSTYAESHHRLMAFFLVVGFLLLLVVRVSWEAKVPYFLPRIRWWEPELGTRLSVPVVIHRPDGEPYRGSILDLSLLGCFVKCPENFHQDQLLLLDFEAFGQKVECRGHVVWRARSTVTHPKGIGVKFSGIDKANRRKLRAALIAIKRKEEQKTRGSITQKSA